MALTSGTKLGPYEIEGPLGVGGMGEVYRARDTRLDRTVAVKILPAHLSDNPEAKQRFEREARTISSLNHPHICILHDIGNENGTAYLVMEYVQGESLADRLLKGPLPLKQALECGVQICDALEKAHRAGIVHRDLKPGNIMLTPSGAKLLDFGLAKRAAALLGVQALSEKGLTPSSPTVSLSALAAPPHALTRQGSIVGTYQFMAPEVLQGKEADARSDIFSFGCVLYEMVTGKRAFDGKSQLSVATAILEKDPEPITTVQPMAPPALDHVVQECLAKDPEQRWQNAADVARELRWIASRGSSGSFAPAPAATGGPPVRAHRLRENLLWASAVAALLAALLWVSLRQLALPQTMRSYLAAPTGMVFNFTGDVSGPPQISSDGSSVAFLAHSGKERDSVWVQSLSELAPKKLEGTEGAAFPFWSADGKYLGFFADGHLKKVPASGGPVTVLADAPAGRGATWNQDNVIIYEPDYREVLWRVSASGGGSARLTKFESGKQTTHRWPQFMPDGKHFVFFAANHSGEAGQGLYFGSTADGSYKRILDADSGAVYASGNLLYHLQSQLLAQKFDPSSGVISGEPVTLANNVQYDSGTWHTTFAASQNGVLVYEPGTKTQGTTLSLFNRSGKVLGVLGTPAFHQGSGRFSPDGKRLVMTMGEPQPDVWVVDLARGSQTRLTFGGGTHAMPSWSADGKRIVYSKQTSGASGINVSLCARASDGGGQEDVLLQRDLSKNSRQLAEPQWSADGRYLMYAEQGDVSDSGVWALPLTGEKKAFAVVQSQSSQVQISEPRLSPDGRWLAYVSTESGQEEIYVTHFPNGQGKWRVSQTGGNYPTWREDSKELYFLGTDAAIHAAQVSAKNDELEVGQVLSLLPFYHSPAIGNVFDATPDGQTFVINTIEEVAATPLVLVSNWPADLKK